MDFSRSNHEEKNTKEDFLNYTAVYQNISRIYEIGSELQYKITLNFLPTQ